MGGGGGGGTDINQSPGGFRFWGDDKRGEQKDIGKGYGFQQDQFNQFQNTNPLLSMATSGVQDFWGQLPGMLAQFPGFQQEITGAQGDIKGYQGQLGGVFDQMSKLFGQIPGLQKQIGGYQNQLQGMIPGIRQDIGKYQGQLGGLFNQLGQQGQTLGGWMGAPGGPSGIIASGGALTDQLRRQAEQQSLGLQERAGTAHTSGGLANTVLNSDAAREARLARAQQVGQSMLGQQSNIYGQQAGVTQQGAGLTGLGTQLVSGLIGQGMQGTGMLGNLLSLGQNISQGQAGVAGQGAGLASMIAQLTGQKAGLLQQQQGLQTGGLNQALGVGNAAVSQFGGLTNPILSYMQGIFGGNQQAAINQAQINAQADAAGGAKAGGAMQGAGSIIGAVLPMLAMLSDKRIKTKIKDTGLKTEDKIPIKTFEYKTKPGVPFIGVMAQDVEKKVPEAVLTDPLSGLKMVDFWRVSVPMAQLRKEKT